MEFLKIIFGDKRKPFTIKATLWFTIYLYKHKWSRQESNADVSISMLTCAVRSVSTCNFNTLNKLRIYVIPAGIEPAALRLEI
jgi:hypothetical protein